jgi:patatin-like phospholipase/acyl hydrolase
MALYHILSLDGGGIRGVLTATLLERLEKAHPGFLSKVDLFAGTSTGGILALGLAAGLTPTGIGQLYTESGRRVFADSVWDDIHDLGKLTGAEYSNEPLKQAIRERIGDITLGDLPKRVLISSFDLDNEPQTPGVLRTWKPKFFHNFPGNDSDADQKLVDVALRTSAAPTYFPIYQGYIDGGVVASNPSMCALAQALDAEAGGQNLRQVTLLSIGTGINSRFLTQQDADWGLAQWAPHLVSLMIEGSVGVVDYQCQQILGKRYLRIDPILPGSIGVDKLDQIPVLREFGERENLYAAVRWLKHYYKEGN